MPSAFENAYAHSGEDKQFAPGKVPGGLNEMVGNDFQAQYHQQKKADAHRMAMAKVQSTRNMYSRANSSPHNYYGMPKAVLGQRRFANSSAGALSGISAREDYASAPFHFSDAHGLSGSGGCDDSSRLVGGVLRSSQGQTYGMKLLQSRIGDFNRIQEAKDAFTGNAPSRADMGVSSFAGVEPVASDQLGTVPQIELSQLLQSILDSLDSGEGDNTSAFTYKDSIRALSLIVRLATTGEEADIADVITFLNGTSAQDGILAKLEDMVIQPLDLSKNSKLYLSLKEFWERVKKYLEAMLNTVGMPLKNRMAKSSALLKTLQFTKLFTGKLPAEFVEATDAQQAVDDRADRGDGGDDDSAPDGFSQFDASLSSRFGRSWQGTSVSSDSSSRPDPRGRVVRREDSQHGYRGTGGAEFDGDTRQRFGYASGEFATGGRDVGFAGEEALPYGEVDEGEEGEAEEQEEGMEDFVDDALGTNPSNAGPRLVSRRDEITGEFDVAPPPAKKTVIKLKKPSAPAGAPAGAPAPLALTRADVSGLTIAQYKALASRVNAHYKSRLPDGKGAISVSDFSKPASVRANFIRRLNL
jgi:hypothetical protein